jgi:hypothetical protein
MKRRILYIGPLGSGQTSLYRYRALQRLQQDVIPFDNAKYGFKWGKLNWFAARFPMGPMIARINADLMTAVQKNKPDVIWFDKPTQFTPATISRVKESGAQTVCYNQDNPFGPRNDGCWHQFYRIYRMLDLHCLFRDADIPRYAGWGLNAIKIQLSYDPHEHFPPTAGWSDADRTREVSYIGSPYEDRPRFLLALAREYNLPVTISGPGWEKAFGKIEQKRYMRGGMLRDAEYRENIWKSKINLTFITRMNEEDVAHKAFEIAACGGFLLALRSPGHEACFEESKEAEFFSSVEECADKIRYYLDHPVEREGIARRGCERAKRSGYDNDTQLARVLKKLDELRATVDTSAGGSSAL